ncbi:MAG TPA: GxxExxY protein [Pirellulales bacterium]|nr:GxxExxY protein [Pirellulales bacterium]
MELHHGDITEEIIGAAFEVYNVLGYGFLEKVYQRAMQVELRARGLTAEIEAEIRVNYKGVEVGFYKADLWVNGLVLVELKVRNPISRTTSLNCSTNSRPRASRSACSSTPAERKWSSNEWFSNC